MICPMCGCTENRVIDTRSTDDGRSVRRRRECIACLFRYTTYETLETVPLMVCKRDNSREPFNRHKIMSGLIKACHKRPVSVRQMESMVDGLETEYANSTRSEIPTSEIGERIMKILKATDKVAYIRFVSVYRKFEDLDSFFDELERLKREEREAQ